MPGHPLIACETGLPRHCGWNLCIPGTQASVGNIREAAWLAPGEGAKTGRVFLAGRKEYGLEFRAPIAADTAFLHDAKVPEFTLIQKARDATVSFEMLSAARAYFGERRTIRVRTAQARGPAGSGSTAGKKETKGSGAPRAAKLGAG